MPFNFTKHVLYLYNINYQNKIITNVSVFDSTFTVADFCPEKTARWLLTFAIIDSELLINFGYLYEPYLMKECPSWKALLLRASRSPRHCQHCLLQMIETGIKQFSGALVIPMKVYSVHPRQESTTNCYAFTIVTGASNTWWHQLHTVCVRLWGRISFCVSCARSFYPSFIITRKLSMKLGGKLKQYAYFVRSEYSINTNNDRYDWIKLLTI